MSILFQSVFAISRLKLVCKIVSVPPLTDGKQKKARTSRCPNMIGGRRKANNNQALQDQALIHQSTMCSTVSNSRPSLSHCTRRLSQTRDQKSNYCELVSSINSDCASLFAVLLFSLFYIHSLSLFLWVYAYTRAHAYVATGSSMPITFEHNRTNCIQHLVN